MFDRLVLHARSVRPLLLAPPEEVIVMIRALAEEKGGRDLIHAVDRSDVVVLVMKQGQGPDVANEGRGERGVVQAKRLPVAMVLRLVPRVQRLADLAQKSVAFARIPVSRA